MTAKVNPVKQTDNINSALEIGGRLTAQPSQLMIDSAFDDELKYQLHLMAALGVVDLSHTLSAIELGVIPKSTGCKLLQALQDLNNEPEDFIPDPACGDLYTNREAWLVEKTPTAAWLGAGRARREAITTAFFIKLREQLLLLLDALIKLQETLLTRSQIYSFAFMPDYTYLQSAQPTTFGHYLLTFGYAIMRDIERLQTAYKHVNLSPAGCGSTTGSIIPQDRLRLATLMGFDDLFEHCRDAMWPADITIEVCSLVTNVLINLSRLSEDLIVFSSQEFALITLHDKHCRASKIMPNKKNPFALTYIRGLTNQVMGNLTTTVVMARTPSGQPDNRLTIYGALPNALEKTINAVNLFSEMISDLEFNHERGHELANQSLICATDLAETLVLKCGMEFRHAHRLIARLIKSQNGNPALFQKTSTAEIKAIAQELGLSIPELSQFEIQQALDPQHSVLSKSEIGGCSPDSLAEMIERCRQQMALFQKWHIEKKGQLEQSQTILETSIEKMIKG
ncbi:MAG TPA: argininosuccinate lyase [Methylococcaceae bacterium]|nr:argininosuccinate lyase [Methylococcaceae bacterium]HIA44595.1 argininosuccinate lyase [Methylococcaceae bacterium]HIB62237.1 argininosuccinate lyase [Methylococcaceae bacterium]HIN68523.1 argininosuccinate lyase [Methylococcales bacterium]HIO45303.1 argininosuccinate lyase [Methylococcales bacterium]